MKPSPQGAINREISPKPDTPRHFRHLTVTQTKQQPKQPVQLKQKQEVKSKQCSPSKKRLVDDFQTDKNSMSKMELVISMTAFCMVTGPVYFVIWYLKHFSFIE